MIILGIETSCDETAVAVYATEQGLRSNVIFSQTELHKSFGGVVPEVASRSHIEKINGIVQQALDDAHITATQLDAIAVTNRPGLPGSLLIGICFAKAFAFALNKPLIGVNHIEGHVFSACIENSVPFPHLCLTASGGHTALFLVHDFGSYEMIGETLDDAAGEAFDKIAKLINLPYPGGPWIEKLAASVEFNDFFSYPRMNNKKTLDFSFSGLKTAVLYDLVKRNAYDMATKTFLRPNDLALQQQVASSLLVCIGDTFEGHIAQALKRYPQVKAVTFVGGVSCNKYLRNRLKMFCERRSINLYTASPKLCTDNGGMIAFVGAYMAQQGKYSDQTLDIEF